MFIILKNIVPLPHYPHAVVGQSGITYGHAMFDPLYQAHIFRLPYEEWAGEKGKDIAARAQTSMNRYHVLVELFEGHILAPAAQLATDLQDALTQLSDARRDNERLIQAATAAPVETSEPADRRITDAPVLAAAAEDSRLARTLADTERGVGTKVPPATLPETPTSVDEAAAGFLIAGKNGLPLEEKRVESNPDTGAPELVEREATPAMSGVPSQPVGEKTVTPYVNVHETRTPLIPAEGASNLEQTAKAADTGVPVLDPANTPRTDAAPTTENAAETPAESKATDDLNDITNFRTLRSTAKSEGVSDEDLAPIKTSEDLRALIRLNREAKGSTAPASE